MLAPEFPRTGVGFEGEYKDEGAAIRVEAGVYILYCIVAEVGDDRDGEGKGDGITKAEDAIGVPDGLLPALSSEARL